MQIPGLNGRVEARTVVRVSSASWISWKLARTAFGGNQQRYLDARLWDQHKIEQSDIETLRRTSVREERGVGDVT